MPGEEKRKPSICKTSFKTEAGTIRQASLTSGSIMLYPMVQNMNGVEQNNFLSLENNLLYLESPLQFLFFGQPKTILQDPNHKTG